MTDTHADGSHEEQVATSEPLDEVETGESRSDIHGVGDDLDDERVLETSAREVLSSVVDWQSSQNCGLLPKVQKRCVGELTNEVDTSELLKSLQKATGDKTLAQSTLETLDIRGFTKAHFVQMVGLDFVQLFNDGNVVDRQTAELGKGLGSLIVAVRLDQVPRCLGKEDETRWAWLVGRTKASIKSSPIRRSYPTTKMMDHKN